jgi:hypothetical protein
MRPFVAEAPIEILEATAMDGAGLIHSLREVVTPIVMLGPTSGLLKGRKRYREHWRAGGGGGRVHNTFMPPALRASCSLDHRGFWLLAQRGYRIRTGTQEVDVADAGDKRGGSRGVGGCLNGPGFSAWSDSTREVGFASTEEVLPGTA